MIRRIALRQFALVPELELELKPGLSVLTGETGAGKSLLFDALLLAAGERASAESIRHGSERAEVQVELELQPESGAMRWLQAQDLDEETACSLRRVLKREGSSRCTINGRGVSSSQARALAQQLLQIHGQHEFQNLLDKTEQRRLLDGFLLLAPLLEPVRSTLKALQAIVLERQATETMAGISGEVLDYKRAQLEELEGLKLSAARLQEIETQHKRLAHAEQLGQGLERIVARLGEEEHSALKWLRQSQHELSKLSQFDPTLSTSVGRLDSLILELEDLNRSLVDSAEAASADPTTFAKLEQQLSKIHELGRKHRVSAIELMDRAQALAKEVEQAESAFERLNVLKQSEAEARSRYATAAMALSHARKAGAERLERSVVAILAELGMPHAVLRIDIQSNPEVESEAGIDSVEFMFNANPGQSVQALRRVASGGELARLTLAIKVATVAQDDVPVLLFDEVDIGVGGAIAAVIGAKLKQLAQHRQVLVITHSPQLAAFGHQHLRASKQVLSGQTVSRLESLDGAARVEELARMLAGSKVNAESLANAKALLKEAGFGVGSR